MKPNTKNYWSGRAVGNRDFRKVFSNLKRLRFFCWLFSVRAANERYLSRQLSGKESVLDVACGAGQDVLARRARKVYGVDIKGAPFQIAKDRGYEKAFEYNPDGTISLDDAVDVVTVINLNAHISFALLSKILCAATANLRPGGRVIFINEYDNDSVLYRIMRRRKAEFDSYVNAFEHFYFHREECFQKFIGEHESLEKVDTAMLCGNPPISHFLAARGWRAPGLVCIAIDVIISLYNNLYANRQSSGFIVGHTYRYKGIAGGSYS